MTYISIHHSQLPFLSPALQHTLKLFDRYRNPFTGMIEHEIREGDLAVMHTRFPELANHRRKYPIDTRTTARTIMISTATSGEIFATSKTP